jgi:hypothetical protein
MAHVPARSLSGTAWPLIFSRPINPTVSFLVVVVYLFVPLLTSCCSCCCNSNCRVSADEALQRVQRAFSTRNDNKERSPETDEQHALVRSYIKDAAKSKASSRA